MLSTTVRISKRTQQNLRSLAMKSRKSMQEILDEAIELYRRQRILEETNKAFAALREDKKAWKAEVAEREVWDVTLTDGLDEHR